MKYYPRRIISSLLSPYEELSFVGLLTLTGIGLLIYCILLFSDNAAKAQKSTIYCTPSSSLNCVGVNPVPVTYPGATYSPVASDCNYKIYYFTSPTGATITINPGLPKACILTLVQENPVGLVVQAPSVPGMTLHTPWNWTGVQAAGFWAQVSVIIADTGADATISGQIAPTPPPPTRTLEILRTPRTQ